MSVQEPNMSKPKSSMSEDRRHDSKFVRAMRYIYRPLGFQKGYNFPLFIIFAGAMLGFVLARFSYLNVTGNASHSFKHGASPGEWFHYHDGHYRVGITIHLASILPAGFLMIWQFIPVIRHKLLLFHRINGYLIITLVLVSHAGALMIARLSFGGALETQAIIGVLVILTTVSIGMAYYNIKRLQIDQHRAWMLRAMFYLGSIITTRIILIISAKIITLMKDYYQVQSCDEVAFIYKSMALAQKLYPQCRNQTGGAPLIVQADFNKGPENIGAALGLSFGMALWLAFFMHLIGIEIYLRLTPAEGERLRNVSYERQLEAGYKYPGSAGLTVDRWGDAPVWRPMRNDSNASVLEK